MPQQEIIQDKQEFINTAIAFFNTLFEPALNRELGEIEIRVFPRNQPARNHYFSSEVEAAQLSYHLCNEGIDVYMGVNTRVGQRGKKENVHFVSALHAEVDYGDVGHKKSPVHATYQEALDAINTCKFKPTIVNHSGGGFHCYWVLTNPINVQDTGTGAIENVNKALNQMVGGDSGTHNIDRVLRVPGTFNFKQPGNARPATTLWLDGPKYSYHDFEGLAVDINQRPQKEQKTQDTAYLSQCQTAPHPNWDQSIEKLPVSDRIKSLIMIGNDGSYPSRSEAHQAVVTALVNKGLDHSSIKSIFDHHVIGQKYREQPSPDSYLQLSIEKAREFSNLTDEEREDPLFISGALHKDDKGKINLQIVAFQEYMHKKHQLKFLEDERTFYMYNGKCYERCTEDRLNYLCQSELGKHRQLFVPSSKNTFIHHSIGDDLIKCETAYEERIKYLTMQNGLYDLETHSLIDHDPQIFTTNQLPYDYAPDAQCPRWLQCLDEWFMSDSEIKQFVQEAVGYIFHKSMPKPSLFFLIGDGGNGKSIFIDTISSLCGKENVSNVSLKKLSDEKYITELFGKMVNVSGETPSKRCINTDLIKAVVGGDWITGREIYKQPIKFKSYAKQYLAMNILPEIDDDTHGMWRRIYVINFPRKFAENEMDVRLADKLMGELSGIFNWAIEGYKRLRSQEFIFSESKSMIKSKNKYRLNNDSALDFLETWIEIGHEGRSVPFKDVYANYQQFCMTEGHKSPHSKREFRSALEKAGLRVENSSRHNNQVRLFDVAFVDMK